MITKNYIKNFSQIELAFEINALFYTLTYYRKFNSN